MYEIYIVLISFILGSYKVPNIKNTKTLHLKVLVTIFLDNILFHYT